MSNEEVEWEGINTKATHADQSVRSTKAISPPIWQTTSFAADSAEQLAEIASSSSPAEFYTRWGNPGHKQTEKVLAALEGGEEALVMSSGMGAIFCACISVLQSGDHVIAQHNHYAGTTSLFHDVLPRWNIECSFVELYAGQALAAEVIGHLSDHGFDLRGVYNVQYDPRGCALQADLLFTARNRWPNVSI